MAFATLTIRRAAHWWKHSLFADSVYDSAETPFYFLPHFSMGFFITGSQAQEQTPGPHPSPAKPFDAFGEAEQSDEQHVTLFQSLIDTGQVWKMEGSIGREAMSFIKSGRCMLGPIGFHDYYGNYVPSRDEVKSGTPGSAEFARISGLS